MKFYTAILSIILLLTYTSKEFAAEFKEPIQDDIIMLVLNSKNVKQSISLANIIKGNVISRELKDNNQACYFFYGDTDPEYCKLHQITSLPAMLRFKRDSDGKFYEIRRMYGEKSIPYMINFMTFKALSDILPIQKPFSGPDPTQPYNPNTSCPPGGT